MATYVKFYTFVEDLIAGLHHLGASGDVLKVYLTNNTPDQGLDAIKGDLPGITEQNGYAPADIQNDISRTDGTAKMTAVDVTFTASGGAVGPFRYAVIYNDTCASPVDPLVCYWDYGSEVTLNDGESFKVDFGTEVFTIS